MEVDPLTGLEVARRGLYVHFPYCLRRCPYCDFTIAIARSVPGTRYADAVLAELRLRLAQHPAWSGQPLDSIYFGGGTPSLWDAQEVGRVLQGIAAAVPVAPDAEVSLEANPEVADTARLSGYRAAGVNRLSLGIQSFDPGVLTTLGRSHSPADAEAALRAARTVGFANVSIDLIHGVPGQPVAGAVEDARRAVALGPEHVSSYVLTVDRDHLGAETVFSRRLRQGRLALPDESEVVEMVDAVGEVLASAGLERYEISSHAVPGRHSRHNALYWTGGESLALGAGAVGFHRDGSGASAPPTSAARHAGSRRWRRAAFPTRSDARARGPVRGAATARAAATDRPGPGPALGGGGRCAPECRGGLADPRWLPGASGAPLPADESRGPPAPGDLRPARLTGAWEAAGRPGRRRRRSPTGGADRRGCVCGGARVRHAWPPASPRAWRASARR
jgi:oxygen-independent coproporphyrinogen-3 oxidase